MNQNQESTNGFRMTLRSHQRLEILKNGLSRTQILQETINKDTISILDEVMDEIDNINLETSVDEKIKNQEEMILDSEVMKVSSKILQSCSRTLETDMSPYNYKDFAHKLVKYIQEQNTSTDEINWTVLEDKVTRYFKTTPSYTTLLGTFTPLEVPVPRTRKTIVKDTLAEIKRPDNVVEVEQPEENVGQIHMKVLKLIRQYQKKYKKPVDFFRLILDPNDFGKTIENMLHVSFLTKDGHIKFKKDESGKILISLCDRSTTEQRKKSDISVQNVITLNMEQWKVLKDAYRLQEPLINFA